MRKESEEWIRIAIEDFTKLTDEEAIFLNSIYRSRYPSVSGLLPSGEPTKKDAEKALNIAKRNKGNRRKNYICCSSFTIFPPSPFLLNLK